MNEYGQNISTPTFGAQKVDSFLSAQLINKSRWFENIILLTNGIWAKMAQPSIVRIGQKISHYSKYQYQQQKKEGQPNSPGSKEI
jgi:hypothetical protein